MALSDYELLAARSFEEPHDLDLRAAVLVCADALGQIEDPRGPLITMEHALRAADHKRAVELRKAMHEYAASEGAALLGAAASLMQAGRTLSLDWRSGKLFGVTIDARYLTRRTTKISAGDLVKTVLAAPAAADLRRLRVRVRVPSDTKSIVDMLARRDGRPPLEELDIFTSAWPQRWQPAMGNVLQPRYPNLYYVVHETNIVSLPPSGDPRHDVKLDIPDVLLCDAPTSPATRAFLGRALTHFDADVRGAALERVTRLGPAAKVFERVLCTLLQPGLVGKPVAGNAPHLPIVQALVATQPSRAARRFLDKVASRPQDYDDQTRKIAGKATELDRR